MEDDPFSLTSCRGEEVTTLKTMDANGNVLYIVSLSKIVASRMRIGCPLVLPFMQVISHGG
ncbi:hypothetical protein V7139_30940 [Neobacillus drentensis]